MNEVTCVHYIAESQEEILRYLGTALSDRLQRCVLLAGVPP